tara:strand:- start:211 stop:423 length:213 start_codon:yes stop_codon:yes gene_type:complete
MSPNYKDLVFNLSTVNTSKLLFCSALKYIDSNDNFYILSWLKSQGIALTAASFAVWRDKPIRKLTSNQFV